MSQKVLSLISMMFLFTSGMLIVYLLCRYGTRAPVELPIISIGGYVPNSHYVFASVLSVGIVVAIRTWGKIDALDVLNKKFCGAVQTLLLVLIVLSGFQFCALLIWSPSIIVVTSNDDFACQVVATHTRGLGTESRGKIYVKTSHSIILEDAGYFWAGDNVEPKSLTEWKVEWEGNKWLMRIPNNVSFEPKVSLPVEIRC